MGKLIIGLLLFFGASSFATPTAQDLELAKQFAVQDLLLEQNQIFKLQPFVTHDSNCGPDGTGSAECWKRCTYENYSSSVCASRCGTTTEAGSGACWKRCTYENYSSSVCATRCGISTSEGSGACWKRCTYENNSSATCASRCGTN